MPLEQGEGGPRGGAVRYDRAAPKAKSPDREVADGVVEYTRHAVNLTSRGRERRLQLVYEAGVVVGGTMRLDAGSRCFGRSGVRGGGEDALALLRESIDASERLHGGCHRVVVRLRGS